MCESKDMNTHILVHCRSIGLRTWKFTCRLSGLIEERSSSFSVGDRLGMAPWGLEVDPLAANTRTQNKSLCDQNCAHEMYRIRVHFHRTIWGKNASLRFNGMSRPICSNKYRMEETWSETTIQNTDNRTPIDNHEFLFSSDCDGNVALTESDRRTRLERQRLAQMTLSRCSTWSSDFCETLCRQLALLSPP